MASTKMLKVFGGTLQLVGFLIATRIEVSGREVEAASDAIPTDALTRKYRSIVDETDIQEYPEEKKHRDLASKHSEKSALIIFRVATGFLAIGALLLLIADIIDS